MLDVVAVGDICVDLLTPPLKGFSLGDRQLWVSELPTVVGGNAANFAFGSAALGLRSALAACVGGDALSAFLRTELQRARVTSFLRVRRNLEAGRTLSIAHADGTRQMITFNGSNLAFSQGDVPAKALAARHVHRAGFWWTPKLQGKPTRDLLRRALDRGAETSLDVSTDPHGFPDARRAKVLTALPEASIFLGNETEIHGVLGTRDLRHAAKEGLALGVEILAVHQGDRGCTIATRGGRLHVEPFRVRPQNPTGAGDAFNAGFIYGRLRNWDLGKCARFANAVAATHVESVSRPYPSVAAVRGRFPEAWHATGPRVYERARPAPASPPPAR